jgi:hypothetical protein
MITIDQARIEHEFHRGECSVTVGPRGGVKSDLVRYRRTGATKLWKTRPTEFDTPIKFGMRGYDHLTHNNAHEFHVPTECPLLKCSSCGNIKSDVRVRPDAYAEDVNNERGAMWRACDDCDQKSRDEV